MHILTNGFFCFLSCFLKQDLNSPCLFNILLTLSETVKTLFLLVSKQLLSILSIEFRTS